MKDLTRGSICRNLITFAIPLVLGNIFQITYNAVDSIIIGRVAGDAALAAVSSADPIMNLLILGISGLCIGASVLMSNYFGANDQEMVRREMETILFLNTCLALLIFAGGLLFSRPLLRMMKVPAQILHDANIYLKVIFVGMPFTCIYNVYAAGLRSVGDSSTPIKFLAFSAVLNGLLDLLFVLQFHLGVFGAALATVIAESVSVILCIFYVETRVPLLKLSGMNLRPDHELLKKTIHLGSTTALQQCAQPIGKLFIQGMVNSLGITTIAAFNAIEKIENIALMPERSIGNAMMTFTAQNHGAKRSDRVQNGCRTGLALESAYFVMVALFLFLFKRQILSLFSTNPATLNEGIRYFTYMVFFYGLPGWTNGLQGFFRGLKHMKISLLCTLTQISLRVIFTWLFLDSLGITGIAFACAIGWSGMLIVAFSHIHVHHLMKPEPHS